MSFSFFLLLVFLPISLAGLENRIENALEKGDPEKAWTMCKKALQDRSLEGSTQEELCGQAGIRFYESSYQEEELERLLKSLHTRWPETSAGQDALARAAVVGLELAADDATDLSRIVRQYEGTDAALQADDTLWALAVGEGTAEAALAFAHRWPGSQHYDTSIGIAQDLAFVEAVEAGTAAGWQALLATFPDHPRADESRERLVEARYNEVSEATAGERLALALEIPEHPMAESFVLGALKELVSVRLSVGSEASSRTTIVIEQNEMPLMLEHPIYAVAVSTDGGAVIDEAVFTAIWDGQETNAIEVYPKILMAVGLERRAAFKYGTPVVTESNDNFEIRFPFGLCAHSEAPLQLGLTVTAAGSSLSFPISLHGSCEPVAALAKDRLALENEPGASLTPKLALHLLEQAVEDLEAGKPILPHFATTYGALDGQEMRLSEDDAHSILDTSINAEAVGALRRLNESGQLLVERFEIRGLEYWVFKFPNPVVKNGEFVRWGSPRAIVWSRDVDGVLRIDGLVDIRELGLIPEECWSEIVALLSDDSGPTETEIFEIVSDRFSDNWLVEGVKIRARLPNQCKHDWRPGSTMIAFSFTVHCEQERCSAIAGMADDTVRGMEHTVTWAVCYEKRDDAWRSGGAWSKVDLTKPPFSQ